MCIASFTALLNTLCQRGGKRRVEMWTCLYPVGWEGCPHQRPYKVLDWHPPSPPPALCRVQYIPTQSALFFLLLSISREAEFLDEIQTKVLRVFLLAIHSHLYSFALRFLFLQIMQKRKEENLIENHTPFPVV